MRIRDFVTIPARIARVVIDLVESEKGNPVESVGYGDATAETMDLRVLWERLKVGLWGRERRRGGLQLMRNAERRERMLVMEKKAILVVWSWRILSSVKTVKC